MRKKWVHRKVEAFGLSPGREASLSRNSKVFSETLEVREWVLEFGTRTISLTGIHFPSLFVLCLSITSG